MDEARARGRQCDLQVCKARYLEFGCEGQGSKIKGHTLAEMAKRYTAGSLAQIVH